ncbi:MAG: glycosyltransferase family 2 protein [Selenomonadaceae bacterium]|nr:glycosyltransferase family 2 protein [Selenomonadaceae bacterium]
MSKKIVAITMVKNEADIIESFVRHTLTFADELIVRDHLSTDDTPLILAKLQAEGLPIICWPYRQVEYFQAEVMTELMYLAARQRDADFLLPLDADEFLLNTRDHQSVREIILSLDTAEAYQVAWRDYYLQSPEEAQEKFLLTRPLLRKNESCWTSREILETKVIVGVGILQQNDRLLAQGNHYLLKRGQLLPDKNEIRFIEDCQKLHIAHIQMRSRWQIVSKYGLGWPSNVARFSLHTDKGTHWGQYFQQIIRHGADFRIDWQNPADAQAIDLHPYVPEQKLKYTAPLSMQKIFMSSLLSLAKMGETVAEYRAMLDRTLVTVVIVHDGDAEALRASLRIYKEDIYPHKEVFILPMGGSSADTATLVQTSGVNARILTADSLSAATESLSLLAKGEYVQWLLPGCKMTANRLAMLMAFIKFNGWGYTCVTLAEEEALAYMAYCDVENDDLLPFGSDFGALLKYQLKTGLNWGGNLTTMLFRRQDMEACQWFNNCFWEGKPLPLTVCALLRDKAGRTAVGAQMIILADNCVTDDSATDISDLLFRRLEWGIWLEEKKGSLGEADYLTATENYLREYNSLRKNSEARTSLLWPAYDKVTTALGGTSHEKGAATR